jgi:hypothetical protein
MVNHGKPNSKLSSRFLNVARTEWKKPSGLLLGLPHFTPIWAYFRGQNDDTPPGHRQPWQTMTKQSDLGGTQTWGPWTVMLAWLMWAGLTMGGTKLKWSFYDMLCNFNRNMMLTVSMIFWILYLQTNPNMCTVKSESNSYEQSIRYCTSCTSTLCRN